MGKVSIQAFTERQPIFMIGFEAGVCWGADTTDTQKNINRGLECLFNQHGRTFEYPDVYMVLDGYSARVIREWYTHIGGSPTRLQASTRYIDYESGFDYVIPPSIASNMQALEEYTTLMSEIQKRIKAIESLGVPREDSALGLPLGMTTKIVCKHNLRNLIDMSHQRLCSRAYHEYRHLFSDVKTALSEYSDEWKYLCDNFLVPKCQYLGYCPESKSCGKVEKRSDVSK